MDEKDALMVMSREMYLMKDLNWEVEPPELDEGGALLDSSLKRHIMKYLSSPVQLNLQQKQGKYGMRAIGKMESGKKLRAFWRQQPPGLTTQLKASELLEVSYDEAARSRLSMVEFEIQLPPLSKASKKQLPSVVYSVAIEPGTMNPKAIIPRGAGRVKVYPKGRDNSDPIEAGTANVGLAMRAGLVDPSWAKGRMVFRKGRSAGVI